MKAEDLTSKITGDLDEVFASIRRHKGEKFYEVLMLHLNFRSLATALDVLKRNPEDLKVWEAIEYLGTFSTAKAMAMMIDYADLSGKDAKEIIEWGQTVNKLIAKNIDQFKAGG
jgi:hypothetical protein